IMSGIMVVVVSILSNQIATTAYQDSSLALFLVFTLCTYLPTQTVVAALQGAFQGAHVMKYVTIGDLVFQTSRLMLVVFAFFNGIDLFEILVAFSIAS